MKTVFRTLPLLAALLLSFPVHAGFFGKEEWEKEDCPKKHSLAWCLADYQGRSKGVFDMTKAEFVSALKKAGVTDESKIADILHTGLGTGIAISEFAFGNALGGGMFLMSALLKTEDLNKTAYMVFFDEANYSRTEEQIGDEFRSVIERAVKDGLQTLPKEATVTEIEPRLQQVKMPDSDCKGRFDCSIGYKNSEGWLKIEKKEITPLYLGSHPVASAKSGLPAGIVFTSLPKRINSATLAKTISENLPASYYWYIPAGHLGSNPFPMFLNQGRAMFFVKPSPEDQVPVLPHVAGREKPDEKPVGQSVPLPMAEPPAAINTSSIGN